MFLNLDCPVFILHLQGQVSQYLASQHLHLGFTLGDMWVVQQNCVKNV